MSKKTITELVKNAVALPKAELNLLGGVVVGALSGIFYAGNISIVPFIAAGYYVSAKFKQDMLVANYYQVTTPSCAPNHIIKYYADLLTHPVAKEIGCKPNPAEVIHNACALRIFEGPKASQ